MLQVAAPRLVSDVERLLHILLHIVKRAEGFGTPLFCGDIQVSCFDLSSHVIPLLNVSEVLGN